MSKTTVELECLNCGSQDVVGAETLSVENSQLKLLLSEVENFLHWHTDDLCTCFVASMKGRPCRFHEVIASLKTPRKASATDSGSDDKE